MGLYTYAFIFCFNETFISFRCCDSSTDSSSSSSDGGKSSQDEDEDSDIELLPPLDVPRQNDLSTQYPTQELPNTFAEVTIHFLFLFKHSFFLFKYC
jgi:hypothetical protein